MKLDHPCYNRGWHVDPFTRQRRPCTGCVFCLKNKPKVKVKEETNADNAMSSEREEGLEMGKEQTLLHREGCKGESSSTMESDKSESGQGVIDEKHEEQDIDG